MGQKSWCVNGPELCLGAAHLDKRIDPVVRILLGLSPGDIQPGLSFVLLLHPQGLLIRSASSLLSRPSLPVRSLLSSLLSRGFLSSLLSSGFLSRFLCSGSLSSLRLRRHTGSRSSCSPLSLLFLCELTSLHLSSNPRCLRSCSPLSLLFRCELTSLLLSSNPRCLLGRPPFRLFALSGRLRLRLQALLLGLGTGLLLGPLLGLDFSCDLLSLFLSPGVGQSLSLRLKFGLLLKFLSLHSRVGDHNARV
mmetsp:Transcript_33935/g.52885  ORF Transcript_33935/g.52885 Transcript_33935/m.52885 type:complete len:249 (+) Transcript_33935:409-1155(+)